MQTDTKEWYIHQVKVLQDKVESLRGQRNKLEVENQTLKFQLFDANENISELLKRIKELDLMMCSR